MEAAIRAVRGDMRGSGDRRRGLEAVVVCRCRAAVRGGCNLGSVPRNGGLGIPQQGSQARDEACQEEGLSSHLEQGIPHMASLHCISALHPAH